MVALQLLLAVAAGAEPVDFAGATIVVGESAAAIEVFAARELSRYFRLMCGRRSPVVDQVSAAEPQRGPAVIVGTQDSFPGAKVPNARDDQEYLLQVVASSPQFPRLFITGSDPVSVQYGAYSLLEKLGVGFYLGGDAIPERRASLLIPDDLDETRTPVFKIRGSLPWYNFLNSPTTWDLEDYQFFFNQMAKMKMNFVGFHSYDHEPFCAYPYDGEWRKGAPAATSLTYRWGTIRNLATTDFGFGTGGFFAPNIERLGADARAFTSPPAFGSRSAIAARRPVENERHDAGATGGIFPLTDERDDAIIRAQCVLAQGLQYATERGLHTCLGFELHGDPTDAELRRQTEARIRNMLATYPMLDYVWFWQQEGRGGGSEPPGMDSPLDLIIERHRSAFEYLGNEKRIAEAARVAAWVQFARRLTKRLRPGIEVIVSGWGGDRWMRFTDFYVGLDKVLPEDVIFAALDNIDPTAEPNVSAAYGKLSPGREKWPIPWFESDGGGTRRDQWGPQCNVKPFTHLVRDALKKKCDGILGIHWQTRGIEEVAAYVAQFAWNPELTYEGFYRDFARKCYGEKHAAEMAGIHMRLETLGPRWTGSIGQVECGRFQWFSHPARPQEANLTALREIDGRLAAIEEACRQGQARRHIERLRYLRGTIEFVTKFDRAALQLEPDGPIAKTIARAEAEKQNGDADQGKRLVSLAIQQMKACGLDEAMQAYRHRLTSQGDFGNLATINIKAYAAFLELWERAERVLERKVPLPQGRPEAGQLTVIVKALPTVLVAGAAEQLQGRVVSRAPVSEVLLCSRSGAGQWTQQEMSRLLDGGSFSLGIDDDDLAEGAEFYIVARDEAGNEATAPPGAPEAVFSASVMPHSGPKAYGPHLHRGVSLAAWRPEADEESWLRWTVLPAGECERTQVLARIGPRREVLSSVYHLAAYRLPAALRKRRSLECEHVARRYVGIGDLQPGWQEKERTRTTLTAPEPLVAPSSCSAEVAGPFLARVTWEDVPEAATYDIHRSMKHDFEPTEETLIAEWPWALYDDVGLMSNTSYQWAVVAVNDAGMRSGFVRTRELHVPFVPPAKAPEGVKVTPGIGRVTVEWQPTGEAIAGYAVVARQKGNDVVRRVSGDGPVKGTRYVVGGLKDATAYHFQVAAIDRGGRPGEFSEEVLATALPVPHEPVFAASFDDVRAATGQAGELAGKAKLDDGALDVREGGWIAYPNEELLQVGGALSVELWVNIERIEGIPVMLSFGHWESPGYWMQLIGGKIRWYLPVQGIVDGGSIPLGSWHHLCGAYDGGTSRLYVDGNEVASKDIGQIDLTPWQGELRIGMYSDIEAQFQTLGRIDDVRIYQRALSADEVGQHFAEGRRE